MRNTQLRAFKQCERNGDKKETMENQRQTKKEREKKGNGGGKEGSQKTHKKQHLPNPGRHTQATHMGMRTHTATGTC